jgi:hypothetical protein
MTNALQGYKQLIFATTKKNLYKSHLINKTISFFFSNSQQTITPFKIKTTPSKTTPKSQSNSRRQPAKKKRSRKKRISSDEEEESEYSDNDY